MNRIDGIEALRRANPRRGPGFDEAVEAARLVRTEVLAATRPEPTRPRARRRWLTATAAGLAVAGVAAAAIGLAGTGSSGTGGSDARDPAVSLRLAAARTAAASDQSGIAAVHVTRNGQPWAGRIVTWNGDNVSIVEDTPDHANRESRIVDGTLYSVMPDGDGWLNLGSPENIDPSTGTTPLEIFAAVKEDVAGQTVNRITGAMTQLTTQTAGDGSVTYSGLVAAGVMAPEQDVKEGETIRVLPYGFVAHDDAADPASPLRVRLTVGSDGVVREITATWGGASTWTYTVAFSQLGTAPPVTAPAGARSLRPTPSTGNH